MPNRHNESPVQVSDDIEVNMTVETWLAAALADAERRGLPELKALLEGLAQATALLRSAHFLRQAHDR